MSLTHAKKRSAMEFDSDPRRCGDNDEEEEVYDDTDWRARVRHQMILKLVEAITRETHGDWGHWHGEARDTPRTERRPRSKRPAPDGSYSLYGFHGPEDPRTRTSDARAFPKGPRARPKLSDADAVAARRSDADYQLEKRVITAQLKQSRKAAVCDADDTYDSESERTTPSLPYKAAVRVHSGADMKKEEDLMNGKDEWLTPLVVLPRSKWEEKEHKRRENQSKLQAQLLHLKTAAAEELPAHARRLAQRRAAGGGYVTHTIQSEAIAKVAEREKIALEIKSGKRSAVEFNNAWLAGVTQLDNDDHPDAADWIDHKVKSDPRGDPKLFAKLRRAALKDARKRNLDALAKCNTDELQAWLTPIKDKPETLEDMKALVQAFAARRAAHEKDVIEKTLPLAQADAARAAAAKEKRIKRNAARAERVKTAAAKSREAAAEPVRRECDV